MTTPATRPAIYEAMRERRSVRQFKPDPVSREVVTSLIEAAITAPSASNKQPWRFLVVEDRARIARMADAVREATALVSAHIPEASQPAFRAYGDYFTRFENAPAVIVPIHRAMSVLSNLVDDALDGGTRSTIRHMEEQSGLVGTSLALMNLLLMAHALGLGASGMTGPLLAEPALRSILEVPDGWGIVALVPIGWPAEDPASTDRKPVDKVVRWL
jgi:nitroreductase